MEQRGCSLVVPCSFRDVMVLGTRNIKGIRLLFREECSGGMVLRAKGTKE